MPQEARLTQVVFGSVRRIWQDVATARAGGLGVVVTISSLIGLLVYGIDTGITCFILPLFVFGALASIAGMLNRPRWPSILGILLAVLGTGVIVVRVQQWSSPHRALRDYPQVLEMLTDNTAHFPRAIPLTASDTRLFADGLWVWFPSQDYWVELRFVLPRAQCDAVERAAEGAAKAFLPVEGRPTANERARSLVTVDDENRLTPLPTTYRSFYVHQSAAGHMGGITINTQTGEVVYWVFSW